MAEDDNISKLIILVAGLSTIALIAYLAFRDRTKIAIPRQLTMPQLYNQSEQLDLKRLEQKLLQLEFKLDSLNTKNQQIQQPQPQQQSQSQPERNIVSMGKPRQQNQISKMRSTNTKEIFDMR